MKSITINKTDQKLPLQTHQTLLVLLMTDYSNIYIIIITINNNNNNSLHWCLVKQRQVILSTGIQCTYTWGRCGELVLLLWSVQSFYKWSEDTFRPEKKQTSGFTYCPISLCDVGLVASWPSNTPSTAVCSGPPPKDQGVDRISRTRTDEVN